jgi:putative MFS transporter
MESNTPNLEQIIENRIGYGKYQYMILFYIGLIVLADGIEISGLSLIMPILKNEWNISENMQGFLGAMLFIGFFIGSIIGALFSDRIGRRNSLLFTSFIQFFLGIYSTTITNVYVFLIMRGLFGLLLGYLSPVIPSLCIEIIPSNIRGRMTVLLMSLISAGQLTACIIGYFVLDSLTSGDWRKMLLICSIPPIIVWYGCYMYLKESPRYILIKEPDINVGINIINHIGRTNKGEEYYDLTEEECKLLAKWRDSMTSRHHNDNDLKKDIQALLSNKYKEMTLNLWGVWFAVSFITYGFMFILPFFLNTWDANRGPSKNGLSSMIITNLGEGSSGILAYFIVDKKEFGRKNSLGISILVGTVSCFIAFCCDVDNKPILIVSLTIGRFFCKLCFAFIYPLTAELYPTYVRTIGIGLASSAGRIATIIVPILAIKLFYIDRSLPFLLFGISGIIAYFFVRRIPYDTTGISLDSDDGTSKNCLISNNF